MKASFVLAAAAAAPLASALKTSTSGGAKVVNQCDYDIPMQYVPAMGTGVQNGQSTTTTLKAAGSGSSSWSAPFTQLLVSGGWSIKLNTINSWSNIMQYEYTWADDDQVWYDMSFVDGKESQHPTWEFQCPDCPSAPTRGAYQHSTDDANGMQRPAPPDATITLVLCPGNSAPSQPSSAPSSQAPPPPPPAPTTTQAPPPPPSTTSSTTLATQASTTSAYKLKQANVQPASSAAPTTEAPAPSPVVEDPDMVVVYETKVVTAVVTETAHARRRRHEHRHPHGHL